LIGCRAARWFGSAKSKQWPAISDGGGLFSNGFSDNNSVSGAFPLDYVKFFTMMGLMFVRIGKILLILALGAMLGANWALLQTVAWTTMLANNLRTQSLTEAVSNTFDGEHPCPLCRAIAAGKSAESKNQFAPPTQKLEFPPLNGQIILITPSRQPVLALENSSVKSFVQKPLLPPPRSFFV
jgi:hypothetical protein